MPRQYDLEERTENFAKSVIAACKKIPKTTINSELIGQEVRSAGSVGANYIEANECLSIKDFANRIKICRKEECRCWFRLITAANPEFEKELSVLTQESTELMNIFGAFFEEDCLVF